jgi:two-component system nitrogen regulation response regulator GlnG
MSTLLVIDDEESVRYSFRRVFDGDSVQVLTARTAAEGLDQIREQRPDVVVLDIQLPDRSGLEVFQEIKALDPRRPVIFITAHGTTETAIEAMKGGAFDYLVKPVDLDRLSQLLERAFEAARLMNVPAILPAEEIGDRIIGHSPIMQEMSKAIGRIAPQDVNVLILGESGTGKELVARALYHHSRRADRPFLVINSAAIPETLLESELFGHEQGAFTGATRRRIGKFEQCDGGTLFLDEIGDITPALQAKMLRVLQEQSFDRLCSNETLKTRVRVLAATNRPLEKLVQEGRFRHDLYYRLRVVTIQVPPLRDRPDDVAELAHYFLFRFDRELGLDLRGFSPEALELLQQHGWPGNVRELQSEIKQAMLNGSGHILLPEFFSASLRQASRVALAPGDKDAETPLRALTQPGSPQVHGQPSVGLERFIDALLEKGEKDLHGKVTEAVERILIARVLRQTHGHQAEASRLLGLNRATLRTKLRALGLAVDNTIVCEDKNKEVKNPLIFG